MIKGLKRRQTTNVTVFEYGLLGASSKAAEKDNVEAISESAFEYLKKCCLCDESESRFLKLKIAHGMEVLQVQNYAGVVLCPDGTQIEILPKVAKANEAGDTNKREELARLSLLMMLRSLKKFRHIETEVASIKKQKMPLMEIFISQFLNAVNVLVKKGIRSDYVREQTNSAYLKGKLLHSQQLKHNFINRHKFYVEYDAYLMDKAENRLVHSALKSVASYTNVNKNKKLSQELLFAFDEVPLSTNYKNDFSSVKLQRGMQHYDVPLSWARLILEGYSPQSMLGENNAYSLLFPMEAVFENFVAKYLKQRTPHHLKLCAQVQSKSLVSYGDKHYFRLKPDLYLKDVTRSDTILDTKWKLIDQNKKAGKDKFGLSQSDFYQMLGYGYKYLKGDGVLILIYPKTDNFEQVLSNDFYFDDKQMLKLRVVPFDVNYHCKERVSLELLGISND
ncbi:McrC family protein [Psychrosphaera sp. 1_MG-2023]|uniref:McrC family protein n=1 Tax=Psychrosphaera sp. 1_MG-2023 TaxID=3062643 RepID=UPI0026E1CF09|nr:McrC family protein [Psychrosphaera sp. 1_MG-2023]MDO6718695.1 McrC family protein [Psychrosphaera sp. 1_MG-2023]